MHNIDKVIFDKKLPYEYNICLYILEELCDKEVIDVFEMMEFAEGVSNKLDNYVDSKFMTQNHNLNFFIIKIFPIILYPIISVTYLKRKCKDSHILSLEPCLMIGLLFQIMPERCRRLDPREHPPRPAVCVIGIDIVLREEPKVVRRHLSACRLLIPEPAILLHSSVDLTQPVAPLPVQAEIITDIFGIATLLSEQAFFTSAGTPRPC